MVARGTLGGLAALCAGDTGPGVLLVPGFTGSKEDFLAVLAPLAAAGHRVAAVDLPGQLETPGEDDAGTYLPRPLARTVLAAAAALGRPVHLLGHSYGGLVTRAAVLAEPSAFRSLTLLGSGPAAIPGSRAERLRVLAPTLDTHGMGGVWAASRALDATDPGFVAPPAAVEAWLRARFLAGHPEALRGMARALLEEPDLVAELRATGVPTLVAHGVDDDAWPPSVQADMAARLGASYVVVPRAAHSPAAENPGVTVRTLLDFWERVDRDSGDAFGG
jgi:pimeloyl-ACP methyl ester carboxylesterase